MGADGATSQRRGEKALLTLDQMHSDARRRKVQFRAINGCVEPGEDNTVI
jgi:hypothetical protein